MCGIVGYVSIRDDICANEKEDFLQDALILDTFRGIDSTGLITLADDFTKYTHKELLEGWDFVRTDEYRAMPCGWAAIGHNRAATKGKVTRDNAHPFTHGPVSLVHNGTLHDMGRSLPNFCRLQDVDSLNIARALGHVAPEEAKDVLRHIQGAYALVWTDERDGSVNISRNGQRPLHFAHNQAKTILWFMSDGRHLEMLKRRRWCGTVDMGQVWQFSTHNIFKFKKGVLQPEVIKYDPFVPRTVYGVQTHWPTVQRPSSSAYVPQTPKSTEPKRKEGSLHRISLNGSLETIPKPLQDELNLVMDLTPDNSLQFRPQAWTQYPNDPKMGYVTGEAYIPAWESLWDCVVHNVSEIHADKISQDYWEVMPYSVTTQMPGRKGVDCMGVMAKIRKFDVMEWEIPESEAPKEEVEEEMPSQLIGPFGQLYSLEEWQRLTTNGCALCSCDFCPDDHDEIWWTGEMEREPLCDSCADELTQCEDRTKEVILH